MLKTASSLAALLLAGSTASAFAADCLQQVDGLTVLYDLPASTAMAGTQTATNASPPAAASDDMTSGGIQAMPGRRRGAPAGAIAGDQPLGQAPALPSDNKLTAKQRTQLQATLYDARVADALGDEAKCIDLLHQAQGVIGAHG